MNAKKQKRVALYARVSTDHQTVENQLRVLRAHAKRAGWTVVKTYTDSGISGTRGRDQRPAFDELLRDAKLRHFDIVSAWAVDRVGRSVLGLALFLKELEAYNIDLFIHESVVDTTTPQGKALFQMAGVFAELEAALIKQRIHAGLARARAAGTHLGRPAVTADKIKRIRQLRESGAGINKIAKQLRVGNGSVARIIKEASP